MNKDRWIEIKNKKGITIALSCPVCKRSPKHAARTNYCPHCGADMRINNEKGYKILNENMEGIKEYQCKNGVQSNIQYKIGKRYTTSTYHVYHKKGFPDNLEESFWFFKNLEACLSSYFFKNLEACLSSYKSDKTIRVVEIESFGAVITEDSDIKSTEGIYIVREIPWDEIFDKVNLGRNCIGYGNAGDGNIGNTNIGDKNYGDNNLGRENKGSYNTGSWNAGNSNRGNWNIGNGNDGFDNCGNNNHGYNNIGNNNYGDYNCGDQNTGDWNISNDAYGCFNTRHATIRMFNKDSDMTLSEWESSEAKDILDRMPKSNTVWVTEENMSEEEKSANPTYIVTGGYLKQISNTEAVTKWWNNLPENKKEIIRSLPNFNLDIFCRCVGIKNRNI